MRIRIKVKANSKQTKIDRISNSEFTVYVKQPPREGRANAAIIKLLSEYFDIPMNSVIIERGRASKNKIIVLGK